MSNSIQYGLFDWIDRSPVTVGQLYEERLELAELADQADFYGYHLAEHHGTSLGVAPSPSVFFSALAQRTTNIRFSAMAFLLPMYHPIRLVEEVCMLDHLSNGRVELGVSKGVSPYELKCFDVDPNSAQEVFTEALEVFKKGMTETVLNHNGEHFNFKDVTISLEPLQKPYPPLWYPTFSESGTIYAAKNRYNFLTLGPSALVASLATLWTLSESGASSPSIPAGVARTWIARYPTRASVNSAEAVNAWTTTAATTDVLLNSSADGLGTNMTVADLGIAVSKSSETMAITLTNNNATTAGYVIKLQARGTAVSASDPVTIEATDSTSQTAFGKRTWPSRTKFIPDTDEGIDWASFNLSIYKDPTAVLRLSYFANRDTNAINEMLDRDISERVTVVAENTADLSINRDFFIEAVQHKIDADRLHRVTYLLSDAVQFSDFWVLNTSALGTSTRLAY